MLFVVAMPCVLGPRCYVPLCVRVCFQDQKIHLFNLSQDTLQESATFDHLGFVTDIKYSPDGALMAACDSNRKVLLYELPDYKVRFQPGQRAPWFDLKLGCMRDRILILTVCF